MPDITVSVTSAQLVRANEALGGNAQAWLAARLKEAVDSVEANAARDVAAAAVARF